MLAMATGLVACGGGDSSDENPQAVLDGATLEGVDSAVLDLALGVKATGEEGGQVDIDLSGPFQAGAEGDLPELAMTVSATGSVGGNDLDFEGGLVLLPNTAFVNYEGTEYEVDPTTFSFVESALDQAQQGSGGGSADVTACQKAAGKLKVGEFVDNLSNDGSADVDGTETTKVSGDLDVAGAIDALVELAEDPACKSQIGAAGPLPPKGEIEEAKKEVSGALKSARAEVYVGDDDIVRRIVAHLRIAPGNDGNGPESVEIDFDLTLSGVNEDQEIAAPDNAKPLNELFIKLGINPIELLGLLQGEGGGPGIGGLLEGLGGAAGGGSGGGGGSGSGGEGRQAYLKCLGEARSAADLQQCSKLVE
jgi:hypothetical protein